MQAVERLCLAGLDSAMLREQVTGRLTAAIGLDAIAFCSCDPDSGLVSHVVARGLPHAVIARYCEREYFELVSRNATIVTSPEDDSAGGVLVHVRLVAREQLWGTFWCLLPSAAQAERVRAVLARLAPHLARGLQMAACRDDLSPASELAVDLATELEPGVLVLDALNRSSMRTPAAAAWFADLADVGVRTTDELPFAVLGLAARARAESSGQARMRARGRSGRWYLLRASLAEPRDHERAVIVVVRPATAHEIATILMRHHALSAREHEIIEAVARGESTKEIAAALGRSPHTVCEHISRACEKLGVRGRKALVAKLYVGSELAGVAR